MLDQALLVNLLHLLPSADNITVADSRVMDEVQIDILEAELAEAVFAGLQARHVAEGPLGGYPEILASQPRLL